MEKYCKSCGRVFKDSDFKICPYCGNQLSIRMGRQPIPRKLRHQVFQRDGYRCRECGATNKQTRLHVDHIKSVAKGGTNDLSNLQTLCEECNRAKYTDEWVGGLYGSSHSNFKRNNRVSDSKLYGSNGMQKEINMNKQSEKKHQGAESRRETTQDKINRWKRAGWGATQEEMERWENARKDKGVTHKRNARWENARKDKGVTYKESVMQEKAMRAQAKKEQTRFAQNKIKQVNREKARIKSESTVVTGEVKYLGDGTYRYDYKTSDGKKGSIYGSSIEDLQIKSRQYKIQWNP